MQENAFENIVHEMAAILSRGRWVYPLALGQSEGHVLADHITPLADIS